MKSHPQNPEFRINPENFHPCDPTLADLTISLFHVPSWVNIGSASTASR